MDGEHLKMKTIRLPRLTEGRCVNVMDDIRDYGGVEVPNF